MSSAAVTVLAITNYRHISESFIHRFLKKTAKVVQSAKIEKRDKAPTKARRVDATVQNSIAIWEAKGMTIDHRKRHAYLVSEHRTVIRKVYVASGMHQAN